MSLNAPHYVRRALDALAEAESAGHNIAACSCQGCLDYRRFLRELVDVEELPESFRFGLARILLPAVEEEP